MATARLDSFLRLVLEQNASDLHFCAGAVPTIRHDGDLVKLPFRELGESETRKFLLEILTPEQQKIYEERNDLDFVYNIEGSGRFRANYFMQARGPAAVFRIIPGSKPTIDDLGMPAGVRTLTRMSNGLVLVTGPTGAGKTTTLAAMVQEINANFQKHIITIEDPIEFIHEPIKSAVTQRQVGVHAESFAAALRSALRESPDVLVVGEMRDPETISLALNAAETGVLVFGTLHTNSAASALDRIIDATPEEAREQVRGILSVLLRGVIAQHLLKRASGEGRVAVLELLLQNFAVSNMIREDKIHQIDALLQSAEASGAGMTGLDNCIVNYLRKGLITVDDASRVAKDPAWVKEQAALMPEEL
jgi:twitching motility protein PilT